MRLIAVLILFQSLFATQAWARRSRYNYVSMGTQYHHYVDILQDSSNPSLDLPGDASLNIDFRIYRIFSLMLIGGTALDSTRNFFGLGFRADLPGFFLIGGNINDLIHRKRRNGLTTYFSYQSLVVQVENVPKSLTGSRFALGMDIELSDYWYLNIEPSIYSQDGNRFFSAGLGLGIEF